MIFFALTFSYTSGSQNVGGIDPAIIAKLQEKVAQLEVSHEQLREANAELREKLETKLDVGNCSCDLTGLGKKILFGLLSFHYCSLLIRK